MVLRPASVVTAVDPPAKIINLVSGGGLGPLGMRLADRSQTKPNHHSSSCG